MEANTRKMDSDTDSEDEVFFGQITDKEMAARKKNCPRRTTIFYRRDSLLAFQKQEKSSNVLRDSMGNLFIQDSFDTDEEKSFEETTTSEESGTFRSCKSSVASSLYETAPESLATTKEKLHEHGKTKKMSEETLSTRFLRESEVSSSSCYETAPEVEISPQIDGPFRFSHCDKITLRKTNTTFDFQDLKEPESDLSAERAELQSDLEVSFVVSESSNSEISTDSITLETKDMESSDENAETKEIREEIEENEEKIDGICEMKMVNCETGVETAENDGKIDGIGEIKMENCETDDEIEENDEIKMEKCEIDDEIEGNDEKNGEIEAKDEKNGEIEEIDETIDETVEKYESIDEIEETIDETVENAEIKMEKCDSSDDFISCTTQDVDSRPDSTQTGISEEFMPIEIEIMKHENFKFIDTTLGDEDVSQDLSIASETSDSAEHIIHMSSADSAYTPHTRSSIETASYFTQDSSIPESRDSDYSEHSEIPHPSHEGNGGKAENDKDCQTSFWYIAVDKKKNCFIEPQQQKFDDFAVPMVPPTKPCREIRKPTNYKVLSENKPKMPQFRGKTPEKKFGQFKYKNIVSPVANYIKGSTVVTPLISNVLSNSISTNQKKKPTFHSQSKIPRMFQPLQPIVHRH